MTAALSGFVGYYVSCTIICVFGIWYAEILAVFQFAVSTHTHTHTHREYHVWRENQNCIWNKSFFLIQRIFKLSQLVACSPRLVSCERRAGPTWALRVDLQAAKVAAPSRCYPLLWRSVQLERESYSQCTSFERKDRKNRENRSAARYGFYHLIHTRPARARATFHYRFALARPLKTLIVKLCRI